MPNYLDAFRSNYLINKSPTDQLAVDPMKFLQRVPTAAELEAEILPAELQQGTIALLQSIDSVTGLDLLGLGQQLGIISYTANAALSLSNASMVGMSQANTNWLNVLAATQQANSTAFANWLNTFQADANLAWTNLQNFFSTGSWPSLSAAMTDVWDAFMGVAAPVVNQGDGTAAISNAAVAGTSQITINGDGTATLPNLLGSPTTSSNWFGNLFDNGDGTATSIAATLNNWAGLLGINQSTALPAQGGLQSHLNNVVGSLLGLPPGGPQGVDSAAIALQSTANTIVGLSSVVQEFTTTQNGQSQSGTGYSVAFNNYPSGSFNQAPFNTAYSGAGSGHLTLNNGQAQWVQVNDGDASVLAIYIIGILVTPPATGAWTMAYNGVTTGSIPNNSTAATVQTTLEALSNISGTSNTVTVTGNTGGPYTVVFRYYGTLTVSGTGTVAAIAGDTATDYQKLQATIAGLPNGGNAKNFCTLRMSSDMQSYVYGVIYLSTSFQLNWELGCYVSGTKTVFASGTNAPLNFSFTMFAGVGGDPYRFQGISGNSVVFDYVDNGHVSQLGSNYRGWGFRSDTASSGQATPAPASFVGCSDGSPVSVVGSGFRQYCGSHGYTAVSPPTGVFTAFGNNFFDTTSQATSDWTFSNIGNTATCTIEGWYIFTMRIQMTLTASGVVTISPAIKQNGVFVLVVPSGGWGGNLAGANVSTANFGGSVSIYCQVNDVIQPGYYIDSGLTSNLVLTADANGRQTYWSMSLDNRSLN